MKRLLTIGHSYVIALNRRLADEMARQGGDRWEVTAAAPSTFAADLGRVSLERRDGEACRVVGLPVRADRFPHLMHYGALRPLLAEPWDVIHCWEEPYVASGGQIARLAPKGARFVFATFQNLVKRYPPPFNWIERSVVSRADGTAFGHTVHDAFGSARVMPAGRRASSRRGSTRQGSRRMRPSERIRWNVAGTIAPRSSASSDASWRRRDAPCFVQALRESRPVARALRRRRSRTAGAQRSPRRSVPRRHCDRRRA